MAKKKEFSVKSSPYYKDDEEKAALIAARDSFKFDEPDKLPSSFIMLSGPEKVGKTHTACTMADIGPVYILDTEQRAQFVVKYFRKQKKDVSYVVCRDYNDIVIATKGITKNYPQGTIVIDSGSDLQTFAEIKYLDRTRAEKIYPIFNWADVWAMCNAIIDDIKRARFNLVVTTRVKEEYSNDKPTGQMVPRIYSALPYKSDLMIMWRGKGKTSKPEIIANGFTGDLSIELPVDINLPKLIKQIGEQTTNQPPQLQK